MSLASVFLLLHFFYAYAILSFRELKNGESGGVKSGE